MSRTTGDGESATSTTGVSRFTFPDQRCPCGSPQLDPDRLYCPACLNAMGIALAEEMSLQRDWGIRGYLDHPDAEPAGTEVVDI